MKFAARLLLSLLLFAAVFASSHAKTIQLPAFDIVEAIQKDRQFAQEHKIDVSHHFVLPAEYKNLHNEYEKGYWDVTWAVKGGSTGSRIILSVTQDGSVFISADSPTEAVLDAIRTTLAKIKTGMARSEAEAALGPHWKPVINAGWVSGQHAFYSNANLPGYDLEIHYDGTAQKGIGRHYNSGDSVSQLPVLKPRESPLTK